MKNNQGGDGTNGDGADDSNNKKDDTNKFAGIAKPWKNRKERRERMKNEMLAAMNDQEDKDKANEGRTQEGQRRNAVELSKPIGLPRNFKIPIVEDLDLEDPSDKKDMKQGSKSARRN